MSVRLLPRLTALGVASILESAAGNVLTSAVAKAVLSERAAMLSYAASGGTRTEDLTEGLGDALRGIASNSGFPDNLSQVARSKFDHEAAIFLASQADLATGESLRDDVWAYMATVVIPDVVAWRFPDKAPHRFEGGVRNALQRLWVRGVVLDRGDDHEGRWELVRALSEDAAVQIFERASIAGNRPLAIALAEGWVRMAAKIGRTAMEPVMRRATKLVRLRNEIIDIAGLPQEQRDAVITTCFESAIASHSTS